MIDVNRVANFERTNEELLEFFLFCLFVRGKNADVQARKLDEFTADLRHRILQSTLTGCLRHAHPTQLMRSLKAAKTGQYTSLQNAIMTLAPKLTWNEDWLKVCTVEDLEALPGVGPKTARYFLMNTRPDQRYAALDTHILQFLEAREGIDVPKSTPTSAKYAELEDTFLLIADFEGVSPVDLDIAVWRASRERHPLAWRDFLPA